MSQMFTQFLTYLGAACQPGGSFLGLPTWYKYLEGETDSSGRCSINFDFQSSGDFGAVLLAIFEIILRVGAIVAVIFVIYGGFEYITSQGEPDRAKNARGTIINALIGLAITVSAVAIVNLIARNIN
jgi:hypothetical protein